VQDVGFHGISRKSAGLEELGHHTGYIFLEHTHAAQIFYFFFESRGSKKDDPVVLWMTGDPSCSSELVVFYDNGPFKTKQFNSGLK
jgi:carboxypeptidase C (cathepsin A)